MNILLIGLDSRKDQDGNELPQAILNRLHAGDSDVGGYNTNTLILVHVGADDRVVAFSIPRDDWVRFSGVPGYDHIKIKEAYGLTKAHTEDKLIDQGVTSQKELETRGREAGRAATLRAVRNLTGVPIDYFAEVNLAGFYDLTQSLGGVEVCLKHASTTSTPAPTSRPAGSGSTPNRRWRSCGSGTAWTTATWTAPTASRRFWCR
ncbi:Transcriptional regulator LytR [Mycobacterium talmoniae]|uniref:Transcriptional regulator LytR n=1 Tax=Mycobacterium talmoniae TaxID=1858794 RepID=A0A2S8BD66_9MYCO|nr:Transcriptional regulator LytR [Mycobacterium talmoniae]